MRNPRAILLENALLDTARPADLPIPASLRAQGDPGAWVVQARGPLDDAFRALLKQAGASIVSYIPNNAYLVRASQAVARQLEAAPATQAVLAYEPYYKLKPWLLKAALEQAPLPANSTLRLLLFSDARNQTLDQLGQLGMEVLGEEPSPFGPLIEARPPPAQPWAGQSVVPDLAQLAGVQEMELARERVPANDLSRATTGVATNSVTSSNYLNLSGANVLVALADSGVDATHPDLVDRVLGDSTNSLVDTAGHGTHVAGIIAGDGTESTTVTNASGSVMPADQRAVSGQGARGEALFDDGRLGLLPAADGGQDQRVHLEQQLDLRQQRIRPGGGQLRCGGARCPARRAGLAAAGLCVFSRQCRRRQRRRDRRQRGHHSIAGDGQERHHRGRPRAVPQPDQLRLGRHDKHDQRRRDLADQPALAGVDRRQQPGCGLFQPRECGDRAWKAISAGSSRTWWRRGFLWCPLVPSSGTRRLTTVRRTRRWSFLISAMRSWCSAI